MENKALIALLQTRFEKHMNRHKQLPWETVLAKLTLNKAKLEVIKQMEITGGEPDVVLLDKKSTDIVFYDCSAESPAGRRSCCYDDVALHARKENKPKMSAVGMANSMGITLLNEEQYKALQQVFPFDLKTSSWIETPNSIRTLGGALFCDRRFNHVFVYHNGAESYYAARSFRGFIAL